MWLWLSPRRSISLTRITPNRRERERERGAGFFVTSSPLLAAPAAGSWSLLGNTILHLARGKDKQDVPSPQNQKHRHFLTLVTFGILILTVDLNNMFYVKYPEFCSVCNVLHIESLVNRMFISKFIVQNTTQNQNKYKKIHISFCHGHRFSSAPCLRFLPGFLSSLLLS